MTELAERLSDLRNLGPASEKALMAVGIQTPRELDEVGAAAAYRRLRDDGTIRVTRTWLWALAGAVLDLDLRDLPKEVKSNLIEEANWERAIEAQGEPIVTTP